MTDHKGIAVVTQTLRYVAERTLRMRVHGASVTVSRPEERAGEHLHDPRLNIYLVQVSVDPTMRHNDLPTRNSNGGLLTVPEVPLLLRYLFSYFGPSEKAQLVLGCVEVALHQNPELSPRDIVDAVKYHDDLKGSGLDTQQPPVRLVPVPMSLEELSRFWSGFLHAPYTLSTVWDASAVLLSEPKPTLPPGAPVRDGAVKGGAMPPVLDPFPEPVTYARGLRVRVGGRGVTAGQRVLLGGTWSEIEADPSGNLTFELPPDIAAGHHTVGLGTPAPPKAPAPLPAALTRPLVIRPQLTAVTAVRKDTVVRARVRPDVRPGQQVALNLMSDAPTDPPPGQPTRLTTQAQVRTGSIDFPLPPVPPGTTVRYLATIEVDGVSSLPVFQDGRYRKPTVTIG